MSTKIANRLHVLKGGLTATPTEVVPGIIELTPTGGERDMIPTTTLDTTVVETAIPDTLRKGRGLTIKIAYDPADTKHEEMRAAYAAGTPYYFTHVLPDAGAAQFAMLGTITKFLPGPGTTNPKMLEADIEFMCHGAEVFTQ